MRGRAAKREQRKAARAEREQSESSRAEEEAEEAEAAAEEARDRAEREREQRRREEMEREANAQLFEEVDPDEVCASARPSMQRVYAKSSMFFVSVVSCVITKCVLYYVDCLSCV